MNTPLPEGPLAQITELLYKGHRVEAIKAYREATGSQLVDAKNAIEKFEKELRAAAPEKFSLPSGGKGCTTAVTVTTSALIVLAVGIFLLVS